MRGYNKLSSFVDDGVLLVYGHRRQTLERHQQTDIHKEAIQRDKIPAKGKITSYVDSEFRKFQESETSDWIFTVYMNMIAGHSYRNHKNEVLMIRGVHHLPAMHLTRNLDHRGVGNAVDSIFNVVSKRTKSLLATKTPWTNNTRSRKMGIQFEKL